MLSITSMWMQVALALSVFAAYLVPEWLAFIISDVDVFVNAWDEETYLSWQGIHAARNSPGYFLLYINWFLHKLGLSGAEQNLLFDTIIPPLVVIFVYKILKYFDLPSPRAFSYAVIVIFSSVFFNYANPLVSSLLGPYESTGFMMAGWELYPSILRSPNPQVSYLLLALAIYGFVLYRRWWLLLLPLPLLYFYVATTYFYVLVSAFLFIQLTPRRPFAPVPAAIASPLVGFMVLGTGLTVAFYLAGLFDADHPQRLSSFTFVESRQLQIPLGWIFLAVGLGAITLSRPKAQESRLLPAFLFLSLIVIGSVNFHLFTGFMLSQKNYYDYGVSVLLGILLVLVIEMLKIERERRLLLNGTMLALIVATVTTQGPWYKLAATVSTKLAPSYDVIKANPLGAVIPDLDVSSKVAYSGAQLLAPPFSYQYYFGVGRQCAEYDDFLERVFAFALAHRGLDPGEVERLRETKLKIKNYQAGRPRPKGGSSLPFCKEFEFRDRRFYIVDEK